MKRLTSTIPKLPLSTTYIIRSRISQHVLHSFLLLDILAVLRDDDTQFTLIVRTIRVLREGWDGDMSGERTSE